MSARQQGDRDLLRQLIDEWVAGWSPMDKPYMGDRLRPLFAAGDNAIHVVDDFEGGAVVLKSIDQYLAKWVSVMRDAFSYWSIALVAEPVIRVDGNLAVTTLQFQAQARLKDGTLIEPAPGQHGTHVWQRIDGTWRIVREHLTNA